jgi:DNA-directed RNA polymerase subunit RPC12/RpoP
MASHTCSNCGAELPPGLGQHALSPTGGAVKCPNCGATTTIAGSQQATDATSSEVPRAPERRGGESGAGEYFSGEESVEGVMREVEEKQES